MSSQGDELPSGKDLFYLGVVLIAVGVILWFLRLGDLAAYGGSSYSTITISEAAGVALGAIGFGLIGCAFWIYLHTDTYVPNEFPQSDIQVETTVEKHEVTERKCEYCGAGVPVANARFCMSCGASLPAGPEDEALMRAEEEETIESTEAKSHKHVRKCMICNLALKPTDLIVWCPHCGNAFHRDHMLEWLHVKNSCPTCGKHLDESTLASGALTRNRRKNR